MYRIALAVIALGFATPAFPQSAHQGGQSGPDLPPIAKTVSLAGPRFGFTMLDDKMIEQLKGRGLDVKPTISQFGWQFEREFYSKQEGPTVLNEWVVLLGGLDQGVAIPSLSWLVG